jgi:predicted metal-dependent phosphoesterase TrpH
VKRAAVRGSDSVRADLHIHTTASDGRWPPERVVAEVAAHCIGLFAIADHDTTAHVAEAEALAREAGVAFMRGVEVSSCRNGDLFHILAYGFDPEAPALPSMLHDNFALSDSYNEEIIRGLIAEGCPITLQDYLAYDYDRTRGGWKPLRFLMDRGVCTGIKDYFANLVANLSVPSAQYPHPADVVAAIRESGGVPILAHPGAHLHCTNGRESTLHHLRELGIAGLECYSPYHDLATTRFYLDWCIRHDLLVTGGSDCHGGFVGRQLGVPAVDTSDLNLGELAERIVR